MEIDVNKVKIDKQNALISDDEIISRIQNSEERRVFYVDTCGINDAKVKAVLEKIKGSI